MDANGWSAVAAGCSAVAAFISAVAAPFVAWNAKRIQGRSADFANCIEVAVQLGDAMRRVLKERDNESGYEFELVELLNLLEALALLYNDGRIAASTEKFTGKFLVFLVQAIAWINIDEGMTTFMGESMTGDDTYRELKKFEKRRKREIRDRSRSYRDKRDTQP